MTAVCRATLPCGPLPPQSAWFVCNAQLTRATQPSCASRTASALRISRAACRGTSRSIRPIAAPRPACLPVRTPLVPSRPSQAWRLYKHPLWQARQCSARRTRVCPRGAWSSQTGSPMQSARTPPCGLWYMGNETPRRCMSATLVVGVGVPQLHRAPFLDSRFLLVLPAPLLITYGRGHGRGGRKAPKPHATSSRCRCMRRISCQGTHTEPLVAYIGPPKGHVRQI